MAKKKTDNSQELTDDSVAAFAADTGGEVLSNTKHVPFFIDTGNLSLNYINSGRFLKGGIPKGITEVYGPPSSSKSLLGMNVLAGCQRMGGIAVYLDCERSANADFAMKAGHVNTAQIVLYEPVTIEEVCSKVFAVVRKIRATFGAEKPILFVWDSIGVTPTAREFRETELPEKYTKSDFKKLVGAKEQPGERAKAASAAFRKLNPFLSENNCSLFVINQVRQAIGVMFGSDEVTAGGGRALPFYANCRVRASATKHFTDANDQPIGVKINYRNKKSRSFRPFMKVEGVPLFFDAGINPLGGLLETMIVAGRVEKAGAAGTYAVSEPYNNGAEVKFKASKEKNLIPADVLFQCPSLVDAESVDEIKNYLKVFDDAIKLVESGDIGEADIDDSGDFIDKLGIGDVVYSDEDPDEAAGE